MIQIDMEMPMHCEECPLNDEYAECAILGKFVAKCGRLPDCPLKEVEDYFLANADIRGTYRNEEKGRIEERMDERRFLVFAKETVVNYFNGRVDSTDKNGKITVDDVFVVWFCKTLQNSKALLSTNVPDGMYYELTYNGDKNEAYLDAYKKWQNVTVIS